MKILIVRGYPLRAMLARDRDIFRTFGGRTTYVVSTAASAPVALRLLGTVEPTASYTSFAAFAADIASRRLPPTDRAVLFDIEKWAATPADEQRQPLKYMLMFSKLAKAHGLLPILAPARDLSLVHGASCRKRRGENLSQAYIRCGFAGADAGAALLVVQSQVDQFDLPQFHYFLARAVKQARAGNRRISVIAQRAAAPLGHGASLAQLANAARSAVGMVQGLSLNVRMSDLQVAEELLQALKLPDHHVTASSRTPAQPGQQR